MKYKDNTASVTQMIVRLCYILLAGSAVAFPFISGGKLGTSDVFGYINVYGKYLIIPFYLVVPAGYVALISLDKILTNIKNDIVFDKQNVRLLNSLTYSCLWATLVGLISFIVLRVIYIPFDLLIVLTLAEAFMTLVVRVVRNVFKKAIEIKEENDLVV